MKHSFKFIVLAFFACALFLTGCDEKATLGWSPDGEHVAVLTRDGLRVGDETGAIPEKASFANQNVLTCKWMPNSIDALVVFKSTTTNWREISSLMSPGERAKVIALGQKLWRMRPSTPESLSKSLSKVETDLALYSISYLKNQYGVKAVASRFGKSFAASWPVDIWNVQLLDLGNKVPTKKILVWRSHQEIMDLQISPAGTAAAAAVKSGIAYKIVALPLKGMQPLKEGMQPPVAVQSDADIPSWSADGTSLFYFSYPKVDPQTPIEQLYDDEHPYIATLNCLKIADDRGGLFPKFSAPQKIASVLAAHSSRVRCLPDGSTVFSGLQQTYPSIFQGKQSQDSFFRLSSDLKTISPIQTQKLPVDRITEFELNQDATRIALSDKHCFVAVLELASGKVTTLQTATLDDVGFSPKWRTKDELCYLRKNSDLAGNHQFDVVLQSMTEPESIRILSKDWSEDLFKLLVTPHVEHKENPQQSKKKVTRVRAGKGVRKH